MSKTLQYLFSKDHTWAARAEDGSWWVGVTDYAQSMLGDVVFIDPPKVGDYVRQFEVCGLIESVKTGSDILSPLSGQVVAIHQELISSPEQVNDAPYDSWIFQLKSDATGAEFLLEASAYQELV